MARKRGSLSLEDQAFIRNNHTKMTPAQIGEAINRTATPIVRFMEQEKLIERERGSDTRGDILAELRQRPFFKRLSDQLTVVELQYFTDHWVEINSQFGGDVRPTEELELKEYLVFEILKERTLHDQKRALERRERAQRLMDKELKLPAAQRDKELLRSCRDDIASAAAAIKDYNSSFQSLADKSDKVKRSLNTSRAQRVKNLDDAALNFSSLLKAFQDKAVQLRVSREMEILKRASTEKSKVLNELYTYEDGTVEPPILGYQGDINE